MPKLFYPARENENDSFWELFHLNTKRLEPNNCHKKITHLLDYSNYPQFPLTTKIMLDTSLISAMKNRKSKLKTQYTILNFDTISTLFSTSYSLSGKAIKTRNSPSAGACYPIEIYFHISSIEKNANNFIPGLYYYSPLKNEFRLLKDRNCRSDMGKIFLQKNLLKKSCLQIFLTSVFPRTIQKYGDRGYRYIFLEGGHIAQNINLVASAMKLSCINIGGYDEFKLNQFLKLDGISHSAIYCMLLG